MDLKNMLKNALTHQISVFNAVNEETWTWFEGTMEMTFDQLFNLIQLNIKSFEKTYDRMNNNCIQFKNMVLQDMDKQIRKDIPRSSVGASAAESNEYELNIPAIFQENALYNSTYKYAKFYEDH